MVLPGGGRDGFPPSLVLRLAVAAPSIAPSPKQDIIIGCSSCGQLCSILLLRAAVDCEDRLHVADVAAPLALASVVPRPAHVALATCSYAANRPPLYSSCGLEVTVWSGMWSERKDGIPTSVWRATHGSIRFLR